MDIVPSLGIFWGMEVDCPAIMFLIAFLRRAEAVVC